MRRYLFTPRWLALHAVVVALVVAFLALGWWQLRRAEAGNARSLAYAIQWPLFAAFTVFMWARLIRDDARSLAGREAGAWSGGAEETGPTASPPGGSAGVPAPPRLPRVAMRRMHQQSAPDDAETDEELAAYNRYLARLNAQAEQRR